LGYSNPRWERARKPNPSEPIFFKEPKIKTWIRKHPFMDYEWFKYHIKKGEWIRDHRKENEFYIIVHDFDGIKPVKVKIKFKYYPNDHIWVHHPHVPKRYRK